MEIGLRAVSLARVDCGIEMRWVEEDPLLLLNRRSGKKPKLSNQLLKGTGDDCEVFFLLGVLALVKCHDAGRGIAWRMRFCGAMVTIFVYKQVS